MAITTKRPALVKRVTGKVAKIRAGAFSAKRTDKASAAATTWPEPDHSEAISVRDTLPEDDLAAPPAPADAPAVVASEVAGPDKAVTPASGLADAQIRTLADLCEALDKKCLELLEQVAAAHEAQAASEPVTAELREAVAQERIRRQELERELAEARQGHSQELAEARRAQAALEREIAALRLVMERSSRSGTTVRKPPEPATAPKPKPERNGEHAARLLPLLEAGLASGKMTAVHDTVRALTRFRVAGMIDAIEGTREAPVCRGWLLSRTDLQIDPVMFLMDDVGLLGWADASAERPDVTDAYGNTKPLPGFEVPISRVPVGRLRGIVAMAEADSEGGVVFEAARKTVPKGLFEQGRG